jgi:hypothetical protein
MTIPDYLDRRALLALGIDRETATRLLGNSPHTGTDGRRIVEGARLWDLLALLEKEEFEPDYRQSPPTTVVGGIYLYRPRRLFMPLQHPEITDSFVEAVRRVVNYLGQAESDNFDSHPSLHHIFHHVIVLDHWLTRHKMMEMVVRAEAEAEEEIKQKALSLRERKSSQPAVPELEDEDEYLPF